MEFIIKGKKNKEIFINIYRPEIIKSQIENNEENVKVYSISMTYTKENPGEFDIEKEWKKETKNFIKKHPEYEKYYKAGLEKLKKDLWK